MTTLTYRRPPTGERIAPSGVSEQVVGQFCPALATKVIAGSAKVAVGREVRRIDVPVNGALSLELWIRQGKVGAHVEHVAGSDGDRPREDDGGTVAALRGL